MRLPVFTSRISKRSPVPAAVEQQVYLPVLVPGHHDRLAPGLPQHIVARLRDLTRVRDIHPHPVEDLLHLCFKALLAGVDAPVDTVLLDQGVVTDRCVQNGQNLFLLIYILHCPTMALEREGWWCKLSPCPAWQQGLQARPPTHTDDTGTKRLEGQLGPSSSWRQR